MTDDFNIRLNGGERIDAGLAQLQGELQDLRSTWPRVAMVFHRAMRQQFSSQGAYAADGWAPLTPAYATWKESKYPGLPIMELSGHLKASLVDPFGNSDSIYEATPDTLRLGTRTPYARYQHYGTKRMPARPLIALTEFDKAQIAKIVRDSLASEAIKIGFKVITR